MQQENVIYHLINLGVLIMVNQHRNFGITAEKVMGGNNLTRVGVWEPVVLVNSD